MGGSRNIWGVKKWDSTDAKEDKKQYFFGLSFLGRIHFFEQILLYAIEGKNRNQKIIF